MNLEEWKKKYDIGWDFITRETVFNILKDWEVGSQIFVKQIKMLTDQLNRKQEEISRLESELGHPLEDRR